MQQKLDFKTEILSKDGVYYMLLIFDVAFCHLGENSCRERTKKMWSAWLQSDEHESGKKPSPSETQMQMRGDSRDGGGGVRRTQGEREREKAREKWGNHYHFSTSLVHLMYPRGNGSNWSLLAADRKQIDSSGGDMRGCLWPPCISKRVCIVNVHSCVTQYGNAIMHPSALNSIFPEEAPLHVCVCVCLADTAFCFFLPLVCLFPRLWRWSPLVGAVESLV